MMRRGRRPPSCRSSCRTRAANGDHPQADVAVEALEAAALTVPTDAPEGDGTLTLGRHHGGPGEAHGGGVTGVGWTYGPPACADVVARPARRRRAGPRRACDVGAAFAAMVRAVRNASRVGAVGYALSAVDVALWDLKARLLGLPLHRLLGAVRDGGAGVRQRRLHHLRRGAAGRAARRMVAPADPPRQDQDRGVVGHRGAARSGPDRAGPRRGRAPMSSCTSTPTAATGASRPCG